MEYKILQGKKVVITRAKEQAEDFADLLKKYGAEPVYLPVIKVVPPKDYSPLDKALDNLNSYNWLIFTSVNGVKFFFRRLAELNLAIANFSGKIITIGPKTKEELTSKNIKVESFPQEYRAEAIVELIKPLIRSGERVLLPRADIARKVLPEELKNLGLDVTEVTAYETVKDKNNVDDFLKLLQEGEIDYITFTSSSTVRNFFALIEEKIADKELIKLLKTLKIAAIGPITRETLRDFGIEPDLVAKDYTIEGLLEVIIEDVEK